MVKRSRGIRHRDYWGDPAARSPFSARVKYICKGPYSPKISTSGTAMTGRGSIDFGQGGLTRRADLSGGRTLAERTASQAYVMVH